jgi:uroporphyrinogen decarboxylase
MNSYERFMTALLRQGEPDRVPLWELTVNEPTLSAVGAKSLEDLAEMGHLDGITIFEDMQMQLLGAVQPSEVVWRGQSIVEGTRGVVRDEWGIIWGITDLGIPYPMEGPIRSRQDLKHYTPPDPDAPHRLRSLREAVQRFKGRKAIVFLTHDGFEFPHYLRGGMENLLVDYIDDPDLAHTLAELVNDYKIRLMRRAIREGADAIVSGDDYATAHGLMMSPAHFRQFILPYLKRSIDAAHEMGVPFIKHTDGNIWSILDMMVEAGIDGIDPIEPLAGMDIGEVKARYGDRIAVIGNVDCSIVLTQGTREEVEEAVKETIAKASPGGGHILASSNSIHPAVKPENYVAMVEAARKYGNYPIDPKLVAEYRQRSYMRRYIKA